MGFGTGLITRELIAAGVSVEVLEGSPRLAAHARSAHPGLIVHVGMFETFQPADPFDAVLALHVLEHVDDPSSEEHPSELQSLIRHSYAVFCLKTKTYMTITSD